MLIVVADLALFWWSRAPEYYATRVPVSIEGRGVLAVLAVAIHLWLVDGDLDSVGLRLRPAQGWRYWGRISLLIAIVVLVIFLVAAGTWILSGRKLPIYTTSPQDIGPALLRMCAGAPVLEEAIYRLAL